MHWRGWIESCGPCLTLLSGVGLGTLLMPVVALFIPVEIAVALTAVVRLTNNPCKLALLGVQADRAVLAEFAAASGE